MGDHVAFPKRVRMQHHESSTHEAMPIRVENVSQATHMGNGGELYRVRVDIVPTLYEDTEMVVSKGEES